MLTAALRSEPTNPTCSSVSLHATQNGLHLGQCLHLGSPSLLSESEVLEQEIALSVKLPLRGCQRLQVSQSFVLGDGALRDGLLSAGQLPNLVSDGLAFCLDGVVAFADELHVCSGSILLITHSIVLDDPRFPSELLDKVHDLVGVAVGLVVLKLWRRCNSRVRGGTLLQEVGVLEIEFAKLVVCCLQGANGPDLVGYNLLELHILSLAVLRCPLHLGLSVCDVSLQSVDGVFQFLLLRIQLLQQRLKIIQFRLLLLLTNLVLVKLAHAKLLVLHFVCHLNLELGREIVDGLDDLGEWVLLCTDEDEG